MDNKQAIEWLEYIQNGYSWSANCDKAIDKAIASLEAWDKVTDELEEYKITGSQMECFGTTEENAKEYIPIDTALDIINKHLKESD
jgi:hypothetical protein